MSNRGRAARRSTAIGDPTPRFLSRDACLALVQRLGRMATGGGTITYDLQSLWTGNLRWARNIISTSGDVRNNQATIGRRRHGNESSVKINTVDDPALHAAVRHCERVMDAFIHWDETELDEQFVESFLQPKLWFNSTFTQDAAARAEQARALIQPAQQAGMLSAGYAEVSAVGRAEMDVTNGGRLVYDWYYPYTLAQYSVTVRDPQGTGSGWAGVDWNDWNRIDAAHLSAVALDKCLRSRNPVRLEPGRYIAILEPQAVGDLTKQLFTPRSLDRPSAELGTNFRNATKDDRWFSQTGDSIFWARPGMSRMGERVIDERLTVSMDPMDPDLGFPPFMNRRVFRPVTWIQEGVLKELAYYRRYAVEMLGKNIGGQITQGAYKMTGQGTPTPIDEMIATTKRGLLVTRFWGVELLDQRSQLSAGYTRDGLWLVENGKISKPVKNFRFTESPLFVLNNVEQIGTPQRIFSDSSGPYKGFSPIVVPALKVRDFSFTSLSDAV